MAETRILRCGNLADKKAMLDRKSRPVPKSKIDEPHYLRHSTMADKKKIFDDKVKEHKDKMANNPFSDNYRTSAPTKLAKDDPNYGRPVAGSKTERRGRKAAAHINAEVAVLCQMIYENGEQYEDGTAAITFGALFQIYTVISNKVVGILLRARKHGLVYFEGETLFQRRDDDVPILLMKPFKEIVAELNRDREEEFEIGVCHKAK